VKHADGLVLLYTKDAELLGKTDRLNEIGRYYGKEVNVYIIKVMGNSKLPSPIKIMTDQKQLKNVEYFNYLGSLITNDARCSLEIKSGIDMAKEPFRWEDNIKMDLQEVGFRCMDWIGLAHDRDS
jgi:hypothetical protein